MKINQTKSRFPHVDCRVGDIQDTDFLRTAFMDCNYVIHAAAQKVVPLCESNVRNSIMTNVMGTMMVCQAAVECKVPQVITILTDKVVKATTVYGAGKFLAGAITREANSWGSTKFNAARYGNVIGSANSIKPKLLELKSQEKPFTITDSRCTRFWLTMDEAIDLILLTAEQQEPGTVVVPKANASPVISLFKAVDPEWPVVDVGIRPGEKIHELLIDDVEARTTIDLGSHFIVYPPNASIVSNLPDGYEYSSANPLHCLTVEELRDLL
jgi:UDP-N-acetylglucosamine 4,6-dehydratase/5-epimerase